MQHREVKYVRVKTLTPLWTGGVNSKVDRIHETGLLGSLRWWYETLVRGLGGNVCNEEHKCDFDTQKYISSKANSEAERLKEAGLCDVCQVFGATGWKRRFRLSVVEDNIRDAKIQHPIKAYKKKYVSGGKEYVPTWYFSDPSKTNVSPVPPNTPKIGNFEILLQSLDYDFQIEIIKGLIQFIADWAGLGARNQMGFGIIEPIGERTDTNYLYKKLLANVRNCNYTELPSLKNVFLAQIKVGNAEEVETFNIKCDLRRLFSDNKDVRHFVMGTAGEKKDSAKKIAAKIKISHPYNDNLMRIWGWIPEEADCYNKNWDREKIVSDIYKYLTTNYNLEVWREIDSKRDTVTPNITKPEKFLQSLLGL